MKLNKKEIKTFQKQILSWYLLHQRDLPWRKTRDPYKILLSEVMSQQTQLVRVIPKYAKWINELPTVHTLAKASNTDVLRLWSGLGYNRRAIYLKKTAEVIIRKYNGVFPETIEKLKALPGIGEYTARALLCFAFDKQVAVFDTNVRKVILITFFKEKKYPTEKELLQIADQLLPNGRAYEWNQALMDYATSVLKREKIPIKKQAPFKTSKRYIRGQIIKVLLAKGRVPRNQITNSIEVNNHSVDEIISDLITEGILGEVKDVLFLT